MKLLRLSKSDRAGKKLVAVFDMGDGKTRTTHFGSSPYQDYTQHHNIERRTAYRKRHAKDLLTNDPTRAGFLSFYLLWGDSTSLRENLSAYKKKFDL